MEITAVEWLVEQFDLTSDSPIIKKVITQAKEMEKQNLINFYIEGCESTYGEDEPNPNTSDSEYGESYYNKTFKNK